MATYNSDSLYDELTPLVDGLGYHLLDCSYGIVRTVHHVALTLVSDTGIGTDACATVYRTVYPRLEVMLDTRNIHLEVGSPGLNRKIRHPREYAFFIGKTVKLLTADKEWVSGRILEADDLSIRLKTADQDSRDIALSTIEKAQLEFSWEET